MIIADAQLPWRTDFDRTVLDLDVGATADQRDALLRVENNFTVYAFDIQGFIRAQGHGITLRLNIHRAMGSEEFQTHPLGKQADGFACRDAEAFEHTEIGAVARSGGKRLAR
ncbi:hypothetical protein D3C81_1765710 [compost metagenome]